MSKDESQEKVKIPLTTVMLDLVIQYLLTPEDNTLVKKKNLINLDKLYKQLSIKSYKDEQEIYERLIFVKFCLKCRREENKIDKKNLILEYVEENCGNRIDPKLIKYFKKKSILLTDEVKFVDNWVNSQLRSIHIHKFKDILIQDLEDFDLNEYDDKKKAIDNIYEIVKEINNYERQIRLQEDYEKEIDFFSKSISSDLKEIVKEAHKSTNYLYSGCKWLNELVGGAFEAGRCYLFLGPPKSFKSGLLLTLALWFRKFNKSIKTNNPNKTPCIVYLTQENSVNETVERIFNIETKRNVKFKDLDEDDISEALLEKCHMGPEFSNIDLKIIYRPANTITTDDIYSIISDVEDEGKEVICFIQDHAKKMRPKAGFKRAERYLELSSIIEDFCSIAKVKNLVFIATAHLNRNSMKTIETRQQAGKSGHVKFLSSSDVGESVAMVENADVSIAVEKEFHEGFGKHVLGIRLLHSRVSQSNRDSFYIPFSKNKLGENTIHLKADYDRDTVFTIEASDEAYEDYLKKRGFTEIAQNTKRKRKVNNEFTESLENPIDARIRKVTNSDDLPNDIA